MPLSPPSSPRLQAVSSLVHHDHLYRSSDNLFAAKTPSSTDCAHNKLYYAQCAIGGILSSSTRLVLTPLEVLKGYQQTRTSTAVATAPSRSIPQHSVNKYAGIVTGLRTIYVEESVAGLYKGVGVTAVAYACQTGCKYSLYEYFKDTLQDTTSSSAGWIRVVSAGCAEMVADVFMCPWEQLRIKVQTSPADSSFPTRFGPAVHSMIKQATVAPKSLFATIVPLWCRQIPATITNFYSFEYFVRKFDALYQARVPHSSRSKPSLTVSFAAGYAAGVMTAIVSHPADSLLSLYLHERQQQKHLREQQQSAKLPSGRKYNASIMKQNRVKTSTLATIQEIVHRVGWYRLATRGLAPRMLLTGTIIGGQWWIYDSFKTVMGMGVTGR